MQKAGMLIFTTEKLTSVLVLNFLAIVEALAQLRVLENGSISDPASLHGSRVRTARTSRPGVACSICALALVILKKNVTGKRKESFIPEK